MTRYHLSPEYQRQYRLAHIYDTCACGRKKQRRSKYCRECAFQARPKHVERPKEPEFPHNPFCPSLTDCAQCETFHPHHHCACGWPIKPDALFCHICLHEQSRVEHKRLAIEEAA